MKEKSKSIALASPFKTKICMLGTGSIVIHVSCSYMKYSNSNPWRGVSAEEYIGLVSQATENATGRTAAFLH
jgi:hypothetical protein